jgi:cell division transport system permease protein
MRIHQEIVHNIRSFPGITVLSILTITLTLYVSGLFGLFYINITGALSRLGERVQMVIFLDDEAPEEEVEGLKEVLKGVEGVVQIEYTSKDEALERFRKELGDNEYLLEDIDGNPLPASIEVRFDENHRNVSTLEALAAEIEEKEYVEMVDYAKPWTEKLDRVRKIVGMVGLLTGLVVVVASILMISFSIGLALKSKEEEMGVAHLVGASDFYISRPFLVEGFIKGLTGGLIALFLLLVTRTHFMLNPRIPRRLVQRSRRRNPSSRRSAMRSRKMRPKRKNSSQRRKASVGKFRTLTGASISNPNLFPSWRSSSIRRKESWTSYPISSAVLRQNSEKEREFSPGG